MNDQKRNEVTDCIPQPELSDFVLGKIGERRLEEVARHVDNCSVCQETVVAMSEESDTFIQTIEVAKKPNPTAFDEENALAVGIRKIVSVAKLGTAGSSPPIEPLTEAFAKQEIGPYRLESRLGMGGMGAVFKATHQKLKRVVALKLLPQDRWASSDLIARFEREMEAIGTLDHPNIVRASDAGDDDGLHFLVMEFVDGIDLSRMVRRLGRVPVADACEIVRQAAIGLQYAHDRGLIHRDVKPSNLMLGRQQATGNSAAAAPTVKILDMGLALLGDDHFQDEHELTTVGQMMGTLDYMSPEQGLDSHDVDARSDIFSLGATLFKLLTGKAPLDQLELRTPLKKITTLATKHLPSIRETRDDLPDELVDLVDRMLSRESSERPESARAIADALSELADGSNLSMLLNRALTAEDQSESEASLMRSRGALSMALDQIPAEPIGKSTKIGIGRQWLVAAGMIAAATIAAAVFYLSTNYGHLKVESVIDGVTIEVRQGNDVIETIELASGIEENTAKIRSGQYELVLKNAGNEFRLDKDVVTVSRNGKPTVKVTRVQSTNIRNPSTGVELADSGWDSGTRRAILDQELTDLESSLMDLSSRFTADHPEVRQATKRIQELQQLFAEDSSSEPTYDGRTYSEWLTALKTERKAERMLDAVNALNRLANEDQTVEAAKAILQTMRIYGSLSADSSSQGKLIQRVADLLYQTEEEPLIAALVEEIQNGNRRSRSFLPWVIGITPSRDVQRILTKHSERLANALDTQMHGANRLWAMERLVTLCQLDKTLCERRPDLLVALFDTAEENAFKSNVHNPKAAIVEVLARHAKDQDRAKVVEFAKELLKDRWPNNRLAGVHALGQLGTISLPAVSAMIELLELEVDVDVDYIANHGGLGGIGGGGMMGGGYGGGFLATGGGMGSATERNDLQFYPTSPDLRIEIVKAIGAIGADAAEQFANRLTLPLLFGTKKETKYSDAQSQLKLLRRILTSCAEEADQQLDDRIRVRRSPTPRIIEARNALQRFINESAAHHPSDPEKPIQDFQRMMGTVKNLLPNAEAIEEKLDAAISQMQAIRVKYSTESGSDFRRDYRNAVEMTLTAVGKQPPLIEEVRAFEKWAHEVGAVVKQQEPRAVTAPSRINASNAKYSGKSFSEWMAVIENERDPSHLTPAIQALAVLSQDDDAQRVAETFFRLMRRYRTQTFSRSDGTVEERYNLTQGIQAAIWQLPIDAVVDAFVEEIKSPNARSREFIAWLINPIDNTQNEFHLVKTEYHGALKEHEKDIVNLLIANAKRQTIPGLRQYYIDRLVDLRRFINFRPESNDEFVPLLQANVKSPEFDLFALGTVLELAPETDGLAKRIIDVCATDQKGVSLPVLQRLGKHGKSLVPYVAEQIESNSLGADVYIAWLGLLGEDGKAAIPALNQRIESGGDAHMLDQLNAIRASIENNGRVGASETNINRDFKSFMLTPRNVLNSKRSMGGGGGGGFGGGIF